MHDVVMPVIPSPPGARVEAGRLRGAAAVEGGHDLSAEALREALADVFRLVSALEARAAAISAPVGSQEQPDPEPSRARRAAARSRETGG
jgi:hypothetical protein